MALRRSPRQRRPPSPKSSSSIPDCAWKTRCTRSAIHYRNVPAFETTVIAGCANPVERLGADLRVMCGKQVVEVKRHGFDKGTGLRRIMAQPPFAGRRPIFLGDDVTDEDGFAVLPEFDGIGISVGRLLPGAAGVVGTPADVRAWLAGLATPLERQDRRPCKGAGVHH